MATGYLPSERPPSWLTICPWIVIILIGAEIFVALINIFVDLYVGI
jgi:uncharacterized Rmd1/YagE family protein